MGRTPARPVPRHQSSTPRVAQRSLEGSLSQPVFPVSPEAVSTQVPAVEETPVAVSASGGVSAPTTHSPVVQGPADNPPTREQALQAGEQAIAQAQQARAPQDATPVVMREGDVAPRAPISGPPIVQIPRVRRPDMTAIRSPIVRMPPQASMKNTQQIQRDTGSGPSQHHANIQSAVFRVSEATRKAQRDMVQGVETIAIDARWSIEGLAARVDGVVDACAATVHRAAMVALSDIQEAVGTHEETIAGTGDMGQEQLTRNQDTVSTQIVDHLNKGGSDELLAAHKALLEEYDAHTTEAGPRILGLVDGNRPELFTMDDGNLRDWEFKEDTSQPSTFKGQSSLIGEGLYTVPDQPPATPFYTPPVASTDDPYYRAFIAKGQLIALKPAAERSQTEWLRGAQDRVTALKSAANRNRFVLTSLGLVAPAMEALKADRSEFRNTVHASIEEEHGAIGAAQTQAIIQMRSTLLRVEAFFDPRKASSQPAKVIKGLRESGTSMKQGLLSQAQIVEASLQTAVADMAMAYPEITERLEDLLHGDDLMDARLMLPRIAGVSDSVQGLLLRHLEAIQTQAGNAKDQSRKGFEAQVKSLWKLVGNTTESFHEQRLKALFHFAMETGMFTGHFGPELKLATDQVRGYAEEAASAILAPVRAGRDAHHRVKVKAKDHFNGVMFNEHADYIRAVQNFPVSVGAVVGDDGTNAGTPFDQIAIGRHQLLLTKAAELAVALPNPDFESIGRGLLTAVVAAPAAGPMAYTVVTGAVAAAAYQVFNSLPSIRQTAIALSLPWPGPLAMEAIWYNEGVGDTPSAKTRVDAAASADADPNWDLLANLFSTSETEAADGKALLIKNLPDYFEFNNEAVVALAASLSPTELALLDQSQIDAMSASVVDTLDGVDQHLAQAYIDGKPARAAAIRIEEAMRVARGNGDEDMRGFGDKMNTIMNAEMARAGHVGYVPQAALDQMTDQMYVEFAARIPAPGDDTRALSWNEPDPVSDPADFVASMEGSGQNALDEVQQQQFAAEQFANRPDPSSVEAAKAQFLNFATRDYIQADTPWGQWSDGGDGFLYDRMNMPDGVFDDFTRSDGTGRRIGMGLIIDEVGAQTRNTFTAYVNQGPTPETYRDTQAAQSLMHTEHEGVWGTSEADFVALLRQTNNTQLNLAQHTYDRLLNDPDATALQRFEARRTLEQAQQAQDRRIRTIAGQMTPNASGTMDQTRANQIVTERITELAGGFDARLGEHGDNAGGLTVGQQIVQNGRMDLRTGVSVATYEVGTHDDLLMQVTSTRARADIAAANLDLAFLGVGPENMGWDNFGETSGDQAHKLELALIGVPENDADRMEIEAIRQRHQLEDGTGFLAQMTMSSSWQKDYVERTHGDMQTRIGTALTARLKDTENPLPDGMAQMSLDELMPMGGPMDPLVRQHLMDKNGRFLGKGPSMGMLAAQNTVATQAYSAEIARQEAFFTGIITAATIAVSLLLLLIPGVNLVAAGIITALISGAALIAVKAGMRGDRYGWEEAGVDMARTGVEAAMGGIGGALGGAVKTGGGLGSSLARIGSSINKTFGKVGGAAVREGITSATSSIANTAMDDRIWSKGLDKGLGTLMRSGMVGAASGALSGGASEVLSGQVTRSLTPSSNKSKDMTRLMRLGDRLGPTGRDALQEAISGAGGALSSEGVMLLNEMAEGKNPMRLEQVLSRLGKATFKDMLTGAARAGLKGMHAKTYLAERSRLMQSGEPPTPEQALMLRKLAISAGFDRPGQAGDGESVREKLKGLSGDDQFLADLTDARELFQSLPSSLQTQTRGMSYEDMETLAQVRTNGAEYSADDLNGLAHNLASQYPHLNGDHLFRVLRRDHAHSARMQSQKNGAASRAVRRLVLQAVPPQLRSHMPDQGFEALARLPRTLQQQAARLVAEGDLEHGLARLMGQAAKLPDADPTHLDQLQRDIGGLIAARPVADAASKAQASRVRADLDLLAPKELQSVFARLTDTQASFAHRILTSDGPVSSKVLRNLHGMLAHKAGTLNVDDLAPLMQSAMSQAKSRRQSDQAAAQATQSKRRDAVLEHFPTDLHGALSVLRPKDLIALAFGQMGAQTAKPADIDRMVGRAKQADPGADAKALRVSIAKAIKTKPASQSFGDRLRQRRTLLSLVPKSFRAGARKTPILQVSDQMFAAYVRADAQGLSKGQHNAMTTVLNGQVVILMRRGAPDFVLREEGLHVVQLQNRQTGDQLSHLTEENMSGWANLPVAQQVHMARSALQAELQANSHMLGQMDQHLARGRTGLAAEADLVEARLSALKNRLAEVSQLTPVQIKAMQAGLLERPPWLAQPARLFNAIDADAAPSMHEALKTAKTAAALAPEGRGDQIEALNKIIEVQGQISDQRNTSFNRDRLETLGHLAQSIKQTQSSELVAAIGQILSLPEHTRNKNLSYLKDLVADGTLDTIGADAQRSAAVAAVLNMMVGDTRAKLDPNEGANPKFGSTAMRALIDQIATSPHGAHPDLPKVLRNIGTAMARADADEMRIAKGWLKVLTKDLALTLPQAHVAGLFNRYFERTGQILKGSDLKSAKTGRMLRDVIKFLQVSPSASELASLGDLMAALRENGDAIDLTDLDATPRIRALAEAILGGEEFSLPPGHALALTQDDKVRNLLEMAQHISHIEAGNPAYDTQRLVALHLMNAMIHDVRLLDQSLSKSAGQRLSGRDLLGVFGLEGRADKGKFALDDTTMLERIPTLFQAFTGQGSGLGKQIHRALRQQGHSHDGGHFTMTGADGVAHRIDIGPRNQSTKSWAELTTLFLGVQQFGHQLATASENLFAQRSQSKGGVSIADQIAALHPLTAARVLDDDDAGTGEMFVLDLPAQSTVLDINQTVAKAFDEINAGNKAKSDPTMLALRIAGANGQEDQMVFFQLKGRTDKTLKKRQRLIDPKTGQPRDKVLGFERILSPYVGPSTQPVLDSTEVRLGTARTYGEVSQEAIRLMSSDGPNFMKMLRQTLGGEGHLIADPEMRALLFEVAGLIAGSETNRDPMAYFSILMGLYAGQHLDLPADTSFDTPTPAQSLLADQSFRTDHVNPIKKGFSAAQLAKISLETGSANESSGRWADEHDVGFLSSLGKALGSLKLQLSGGVMPFTAVKYLDNIEIARLLADRAHLTGETLEASNVSGKHGGASIIRRFAELFELVKAVGIAQGHFGPDVTQQEVMQHVLVQMADELRLPELKAANLEGGGENGS